MPRSKSTGQGASQVLSAKPSQPKSTGRRTRVSKTSTSKSKSDSKAAVKSSSSEKVQKSTPATKTPKSSKPTSASYNPNNITNFTDLLAAIDAKSPKIILSDNIIATSNITINHDIVLDLNGHSIISEEITSAARVIDVRSGKVKITGQGKIFAMGERGVAVRVFGAISSGVPDYTHLTIDENVSLFAPNAYGILISPNLGVAYGLVLDFAGQIIARDGICLSNGVRGYEQNAPVIKLRNSAQITADEAAGIALDASGYGTWEIAGAKLHGAIGALMYTGSLKFTQAQIIAGVGAAFQIGDGPSRTLGISVNGGSYVAANEDLIIGERTALKRFSVKDCDFCSEYDHIADEIAEILKLNNVNFRSDVEQVIKELTLPKEPTEEPTESAAASSVAGASTEITEEETKPDVRIEELTTDELLAGFADAEMIIDTSENAPKDLAKPQATAETSDAELEDFFEDQDIAMAEAELEALQPTKKSRKKSKLATAVKLAKSARATKALVTPPVVAAPETLPDPTESENADQTISATVPELIDNTPELTSDVIPKLTDDLTLGLSDEDTDEQEILRELRGEEPDYSAQPTITPSKQPSAPALPAFAAPPEPVHLASEQSVTPPEPVRLITSEQSATPLAPTFMTAEQTAARETLADALVDIRKLRPDDYTAGFAELEQAIARAEAVLADQFAELNDICNAASGLLTAFDGLEERTELLLSDAELDDLFYHGAVLAEMTASPSPNLQNTEQHTAAALNSAAEPPAEPDFTVLNDVLTTISELNLAEYSESSQINLLQTLDYAQNVLLDKYAPQGVVDEIATRLVADMSKLELRRRTHSERPNVQVNAPAPVVNRILPATMLDEMAPTTFWSQGITMIDEQEPCMLDASTRERITRAMRPWAIGLIDLITEPIRNVTKSLKAGARAGMRTYRETLQAMKN